MVRLHTKKNTQKVHRCSYVHLVQYSPHQQKIPFVSVFIVASEKPDTVHFIQWFYKVCKE